MHILWNGYNLNYCKSGGHSGKHKNHPTDYILKKIVALGRNVTKLNKNVVFDKLINMMLILFLQNNSFESCFIYFLNLYFKFQIEGEKTIYITSTNCCVFYRAAAFSCDGRNLQDPGVKILPNEKL